MKRLTLFLIVYLLFSTQTVVYSEVTLPRVIGSNMVLQRDMQVPIWGWASAGEEVTIILSAEAESVEPVATATAVADAEGNWQTKLPATQAGGPYTLQIKGNNTLELRNILFGEVWICSGQIKHAMARKCLKRQRGRNRSRDVPENPTVLCTESTVRIATAGCRSKIGMKPRLRQLQVSPLSPTISDGNSIKIWMSRSG